MIIECVVKLFLFNFYQGLTYLVLEGILVCLRADTFSIPIND